ncbi:hypothetical protein ASD8599_00319 [Ascidiaceihabitans donghaensis]|uniref:Uncharacterized protein n=1 Tax=Ascidiaceihabitans donghaensis TaxID=1510460 RepID=A0A2R8B962_9RHOB|nr:hypothetical protein ASD8599_00319 [Ascidiaceihabitans donghaensis]
MGEMWSNILNFKTSRGIISLASVHFGSPRLMSLKKLDFR